MYYNKMKKIILIIIILMIGIGLSIYYYRFNPEYLNNMKTETSSTSTSILTETSTPMETIRLEAVTVPNKFFQFEAKPSEGISGKIYLNKKLVYEFTNLGGMISRNDVHEMIIDGENTIELKIDKVDSTITPNSVVDISLYRVILYPDNSVSFSEDEDRTIHVVWNPTTNLARDILYVFSIKK